MRSKVFYVVLWDNKFLFVYFVGKEKKGKRGGKGEG